MNAKLKVLALAVFGSALVGCGGGDGKTSEVTLSPPESFFGTNTEQLAGYPQCVFTPKGDDATNAQAVELAKQLTEQTYSTNSNFQKICSETGTAKLLDIDASIADKTLTVARIDGKEYIVVNFNTDDRFVLTGLDGDTASITDLEAQAGGFTFEVSLGMVDDARTDGRVPVINTGAIIQRENSQITVKADGTIDLTPEGESNRFVDIVMIDDGGSQDWFANSADDLFEFVNINDTKNREYIEYLMDGVTYGTDVENMLLTYSYSTNGHANGITGTYYSYRDDFEVDEGDVTVKTMIRNAQTRMEIDGAGNVTGVIKEFIVYNANQGEDRGQVLVRIYNRDPNINLNSIDRKSVV